MAEYSYNDIMKMQNDAIRRVNEMQRRAKTVVEEINEENVKSFDETPQHSTSTDVKRVKMPDDYLNELKNFASTSSYFEEPVLQKKQQYKTDEKKTSKTHPETQNDIFKNILSDLNMDSDKALILSLVLLLAEEKADEFLILALLYILS